MPPRCYSVETPRYRCQCYLAPWDEATFHCASAELVRLKLLGEEQEHPDFKEVWGWFESHAVKFCTARVPHSDVRELNALEREGFRFIELNYRPTLKIGRSVSDAGKVEFNFTKAAHRDRAALADMCETIFQAGRFHMDPRLGTEIGNRRYRAWMENAFDGGTQSVLVCRSRDAVAAFFVIERTSANECFWSLMGLSPQTAGRGLAGRIYRDFIKSLAEDGVDSISTSISSHNVPVMNLLVSLGFRFPSPTAILHWSDDALATY